jgi:hypothetical protein
MAVESASQSGIDHIKGEHYAGEKHSKKQYDMIRGGS